MCVCVYMCISSSHDVCVLCVILSGDRDNLSTGEKLVDPKVSLFKGQSLIQQ